jgi:alkylated DNA repair dioxygenase AlkB
MRPLFPSLNDVPTVPEIPGLSYRPNYITAEDEAHFAKCIDCGSWDTTWKRRRQLYGASYGAKWEEVAAIPEWAQALIDRLHADGIGDWRFDQMLVNEYLPGQGISMHRDHEPFDRTVVSLSLLSRCIMDFRQPEANRHDSMLLEPRSLLVLSDEARYKWEHGIAARKNDRWLGEILPRRRRLSMTFRRMKTQSA